MSVRVEPATREHAAPLAALFEREGCPCYCHFWHFEGDDNAWELRCATEREKNREALAAAFVEGGAQASGIVALDPRGDVVGWLKLSAAGDVPKVKQRRLYRSLPYFKEPRAGVLVIGCLLVLAASRKQGVAGALVDGAILEGRRRGARAIEAMPRHTSEPVGDDALWLGPIGVYLERGFVRVDGPDTYPVLRLELEVEVERGASAR